MEGVGGVEHVVAVGVGLSAGDEELKGGLVVVRLGGWS